MNRGTTNLLCPVEVDERSVPGTSMPNNKGRSPIAATVEAKPDSPEKQPRRGGKAVLVADVESRRRRASDRGFLPLSLPKYLALVDWTGRQVRHDKRGAIPAELKPILERLSLDPDHGSNACGSSAAGSTGPWERRRV